MSALNTKRSYRTAESVTPKHPDKLCDQISDAILDAYLEKDPQARVAVDVAAGHGLILVTGEITSGAEVSIEPIINRLAGKLKVTSSLAHQSLEIAAGVDSGGAGDQGIMIGYASQETRELLPLEVVLSRQLAQYLYKQWPYDGKTQVTLQAEQVVAVVASFQYAPADSLRAAIERWLSDKGVGDEVAIYCNPAGDWRVGGFDADAGLTGRKLVVDNYGPRIPIGGGAFSGKDATKVDRSAAYMARKIACDYLRKKGAEEVYVRLAYAIGYNQPLEASVMVDGQQEAIVGYDLSPRAIIEQLDLLKPQFEATARWGHFGHSAFSWER